MPKYYLTIEDSIGGYHAVFMGPDGPELTGDPQVTPQQAEQDAISWAEQEGLKYIAPIIDHCPEHPHAWRLNYVCTDCNVEHILRRQAHA